MKQKKIRFFHFQDDDPDFLFERHNNSDFVIQNKSLFIKLDNNELVPVELESCIIDLDLNLKEDLLFLLNESINIAGELSLSPIEENYETREKIESALSSTINIFLYKEHKYFFEFITELFVKFLMFHMFRNGNKRVSLSFLVIILHYFGYDFKWTKSSDQENKKHEDLLEKFVENMQRTEECNLEKNKEEIRKWIEAHSMIVIK